MDTTNIIFNNIKSAKTKQFETMLKYVEPVSQKHLDSLYIKIHSKINEANLNNITEEQQIHIKENVYSIKQYKIGDLWWDAEIRRYNNNIEKRYVVTLSQYITEYINTAYYELRETHLYYFDNIHVMTHYDIISAIVYFYQNEAEIKKYLIKLVELRENS